MFLFALAKRLYSLLASDPLPLYQADWQKSCTTAGSHVFALAASICFKHSCACICICRFLYFHLLKCKYIFGRGWICATAHLWFSRATFAHLFKTCHIMLLYLYSNVCLLLYLGCCNCMSLHFLCLSICPHLTSPLIITFLSSSKHSNLRLLAPKFATPDCLLHQILQPQIACSKYCNLRLLAKNL